MNSRTLLSLSLTVFSIVGKIRPSSTSFDFYSSCSNLYGCGSVRGIGYPFWGENRPEGCGYPSLKLACEKNVTTMNINGVKYQVVEVSESDQIITIARFDFLSGLCPSKFLNTTLDYNLFDLIPNSFLNISLLYCTSSSNGAAGLFSCHPQYDFGLIVGGAHGPVYNGLTCNASVVIPISMPAGNTNLHTASVVAAIKRGFDVRLKVETDKCAECVDSKGVCGYDWVLNRTSCYCSDRSISSTNGCPLSPDVSGGPVPSSSVAQKKNLKHLKIGLAVGAVFLLAIFLACWSFYIKQRKKYVLQSKTIDLSTAPSSKENNNDNVSTTLITTNISPTQRIPSYLSSTLSLQNRSTYFGAQVFSYTDLQKATDNFHSSRKLGDGGYGTVYYGKLGDGREVAVKCLYENNFKRVQQFMNEVEILTRLEHPNLVKLYGCTSRHSQELLLVYEYIPNGTIADHIHGKKRTNPGPLTWPVRLNMAIETADALAYLHRSDSIHRDVKTNNILLDNKFHVKVADFGLSRLFPNDVSHVSTAPQGTPGYVDPEYYQCHQLTYKSDVFSYGVVLIELISSLQAVDTSRHKHDINLANMAVNKIQNHALNELVDPSLGFNRDYGIRQKVTSVAELAFQCLQQIRDTRPSMEEVMDVLRRIEDEKLGAEKAVVVDVGADDVGLLKHMPLLLSLDSVVNDKWVSNFLLCYSPNSFLTLSADHLVLKCIV